MFLCEIKKSICCILYINSKSSVYWQLSTLVSLDTILFFRYYIQKYFKEKRHCWMSRDHYPANIEFFKVNKKTRRRCEIYSKLTIETPEKRHLLLTLNLFHTFFQCFYCLLWTSKFSWIIPVEKSLSRSDSSHVL